MLISQTLCLCLLLGLIEKSLSVTVPDLILEWIGKGLSVKVLDQLDQREKAFNVITKEVGEQWNFTFKVDSKKIKPLEWAKLTVNVPAGNQIRHFTKSSHLETATYETVYPPLPWPSTLTFMYYFTENVPDITYGRVLATKKPASEWEPPRCVYPSLAVLFSADMEKDRDKLLTECLIRCNEREDCGWVAYNYSHDECTMILGSSSRGPGGPLNMPVNETEPFRNKIPNWGFYSKEHLNDPAYNKFGRVRQLVKLDGGDHGDIEIHRHERSFYGGINRGNNGNLHCAGFLMAGGPTSSFRSQGTMKKILGPDWTSLPWE